MDSFCWNLMHRKFSIRTLLGAIALVAVGMATVRKLRYAYFHHQLTYYADRDDGCGVHETLLSGIQLGFHSDWADDVLADSAASGKTAMLRMFNYEHDINRSISGDRTALMHAAAHGQFHAAKQLIELGADATLRDASGSTAEQIAVTSGHTATAALLSAYRDGTWANVRHVEELVDAHSLTVAQSGELTSRIVDTDCLPDEEIWYRANDRFSIGRYKNVRGRTVWLVDGARIDDVQMWEVFPAEQPNVGAGTIAEP